MSFNDIVYWFKDNSWEICILACVIILLSTSIYNLLTHQEGKWCIPFKFPKQQQKDGEPIYQSSCESKGEAIVRQYLCQKFNKPFEKIRNIYNPITGQYLELDCYNSELSLAVEYQGKQHYIYTPYFHKNIEAFRNQQYRDELKRLYCKEKKIILLEVPYTIKHVDIPNYLDYLLTSYNDVIFNQS